MKRISIIIVTYNSTKDIRDCLLSIYKNNDIGNALEIIVVDNKSQDIDNLKIILNEFPSVLLIENEKNGGYGQGNNEGIKKSSAPIIMIMNPDVRLFMPVFQTAISHFEDTSNLGMLGFLQYEKEGIMGNSYLPLGHSLLTFIRYLFYKRLERFNPRYLMISGACFFLRKDYFDRIGLFDENIFMYGEEYDINKRMRSASYKIEFDKTIGYIHPVHNREYSSVSENMELESFIYTRKKHGQNIKVEIINTILILYIMLVRAYFKKDKLAFVNYTNAIDFYKVALTQIIKHG